MRRSLTLHGLAFLATTAFLILMVWSHLAGAAGGWTHYRKDGGVGPARVVFVRGCIAAEDSAAHVKLLDYDGERVVFGCDRNGY
jgi:hypothetical protein